MGFFGVLGGYFICDDCPLTFYDSFIGWFLGSFLFFILWKGNEFVANKLDRFYPWLYYPAKRFAFGILVAVIFTTGVLLIVGIGINLVLDIPFDSNQMLPLYFANGMAVFMFCFIVARQFLLSWQELALREEKMKNEVLSARYESLKNQVNPHFLFNCLNSLSSLINEDTKVLKLFKQ